MRLRTIYAPGRDFEFTCKQARSGVSRKRSRFKKKNMSVCCCFKFVLQKNLLMLEILCRAKWLMCLEKLL